MTKPLPPERRKIGFWMNVEKGPDKGKGPLGGCWLWRGTVRDGGYGQCCFNGRTATAHRASWIMANGPIPSGLLVLHKCDVRNCIRPTHLFLGTYRDNMIDMYSKGRGPIGRKNGSRTKPERRAWGDRNGSRTHPESRPRGDSHWLHVDPAAVAGERNPNAKLTAKDVSRIKILRGRGMTQVALATMFRVTQVHISRILRGKAWTGPR